MRAAALIACMLAACCPVQGARPGSIAVGDARVTTRVKSWRELKRERVLLQREDASCGAAALATLMTYFWGVPRTEREVLDVLRGVVGHAYANKLRYGFSLLDLKHASDRLGFEAAGFRLRIDELAQLEGAVILHMQHSGYLHFVVYRGIRGDRIAIADPFQGNVTMPVARFRERWTGVVFVVEPRADVAQPSSDFWRSTAKPALASRSNSTWIFAPTF